MKEEILQKALEQFLKHGIRKVSNDKLVEVLGISTKTLYKYFKNKEELLEHVLQLFFAQAYEELQKLPPEQGAPSLFFDLWYKAVEGEYNVNKAFFQDLHYYYPELGIKTEAAISKKFSKEFLIVIKKGIKEGTFREDIIPEVVLENIYVQYTSIVRTEHFKRFRLSAYDLLINTITVSIRGICTFKGVEELENHTSIAASKKVTKSRTKVLAKLPQK